ncbi:DUF3179 domain-containing protein [soil metagenome]
MTSLADVALVRVLAVTLSALAVGCGGTTAPGAAPASSVGATGATPATATSDEPTPFFWEPEAAGVPAPATSVNLDEIRPGGPPPDGIPPIDEPRFTAVAEAELADREPVMVVERGGETHVYPLAILTFHEIVNDVIAGEPTLVTYCPLCNSALAFDPVVDGRTLDFGTSGRLWRSNLVMYDRQTHTLWSQFVGEAVVGELLGTELERLPSAIVAWSDARAARPEAQVLSRDTGHDRPYGSNPYVGYDTAAAPFLFSGDTGGPLGQMERVVAVGEADPVALPLPALREQRVVPVEVDGRDLVVLWTPDTASALDTGVLADGADVGATGVFEPVADGRTLEFSAAGEDGFTDAQTGSRWTVLGEAVEGPLAGQRLTRVPHDDTFWFVQYAFRPGTRVAR